MKVLMCELRHYIEYFTTLYVLKHYYILYQAVFSSSKLIVGEPEEGPPFLLDWYFIPCFFGKALFM